jgi:hypothetical protein
MYNLMAGINGRWQIPRICRFMEADQWNIRSVTEGAKEPDYPGGLHMIRGLRRREASILKGCDYGFGPRPSQ